MLSLVMAVYDDFEGACFTVRSALMHHTTVNDIVIVDNNPNSSQGVALESFSKACGSKVSYYSLLGIRGTAAPRDMAIQRAKNPHVVCCDPHVLFPPGSLHAVYNYMTRSKDPVKDILSGPLINEQDSVMATHFDFSTWGAGMWGQWALDAESYKAGRPFEIPGMGLGAFAVNRDHWLGFNPSFSGFGGEEGYIHEKYRKAGRKALCLPGFKWWHRFTRPAGVPYPLISEEKARNYVIGFRELGMDVKPIYDHFVKGELIPAVFWPFIEHGELPPVPNAADQQVKDQVRAGCNSCAENSMENWPLSKWYDHAKDIPGDINEHIPTLKEMAQGKDVVVEFGVRTGVSTAGLLAGRPKLLLSYDINESPHARSLAKAALREKVKFEFHLGDSTEVTIPECDLLFIDTKHTAEHLYRELKKHHEKVRGKIVMHDTEIFGDVGEDGTLGLRYAIRQFLKEHPEWYTARHDNNNHGLTVLSKDPAEAPPPLPSKLKMAMNYTVSQAKDLANGRTRVPLEVADERYKICTSNGGRCPAKQRNIDTDRCAGCGCWLYEQIGPTGTSIGPKTGKVWRPLDACPFGYWGNYVADDVEHIKEEEGVIA